MTNAHLKFAAASVVALTAFAGAAAAQEAAPNAGPYVSVGAGVTMPDAQRLTVPGINNTGATQQFTFDKGLNVTGAFGYKWTSGLRAEAEIDYRHADVDRVNGFSSDGSQRIWSGMANLLYDFPTDWKITPYVGGGVGIGTDHWHQVQGGPIAGFPAPTFDNSDGGRFQWQGIAGLNLSLNPQTVLFADYRYIDLDSQHFNVRPIGTFESGHDDRSNNVLVGIRYFFHGA